MTTGDGTAMATKPKISAMERGTACIKYVWDSRSSQYSVLKCVGPGPARYNLPGLTGNSGHDATKKIQPAYSFGKRLGTSCAFFVSLCVFIANFFFVL